MKKTIITALLTLVAMTGLAQIHYQIDGNTEIPISQERFTFTIIHHSWIPFRS